MEPPGGTFVLNSHHSPQISVYLIIVELKVLKRMFLCRERKKSHTLKSSANSSPFQSYRATNQTKPWRTKVLVLNLKFSGMTNRKEIQNSATLSDNHRSLGYQKWWKKGLSNFVNCLRGTRPENGRKAGEVNLQWLSMLRPGWLWRNEVSFSPAPKTR